MNSFCPEMPLHIQHNYCMHVIFFMISLFFGLKRYYGESLPFGKESFEHDKVGYLTIEQAMADYAVLITELKVQFKATKSKVVAFGGR